MPWEGCEYHTTPHWSTGLQIEAHGQNSKKAACQNALCRKAHGKWNDSVYCFVCTVHRIVHRGPPTSPRAETVYRLNGSVTENCRERAVNITQPPIGPRACRLRRTGKIQRRPLVKMHFAERRTANGTIRCTVLYVRYTVSSTEAHPLVRGLKRYIEIEGFGNGKLPWEGC